MGPVYLGHKNYVMEKTAMCGKISRLTKNVDVKNIQYQFLVMGRIFNFFENALPLGRGGPPVMDISGIYGIFCLKVYTVCCVLCFIAFHAIPPGPFSLRVLKILCFEKLREKIHENTLFCSILKCVSIYTISGTLFHEKFVVQQC